MSKIKRIRTGEGTEYTMSYNSIKGVDMSSCGSDISRSRYSYIENMYRDYEGEGGGLIESVPGFRKLYKFESKINRIFLQRTGSGEFMVVHSGDKLYRFSKDEKDTLDQTLAPIAEVEDTVSSGFCHGGSLYVLDGKKMTHVSPDGTATYIGNKDGFVEPYVPTTYLNGTRHEQANLLTDKFKEKYTVGSADSVTYGTYGLYYRIKDSELKQCEVIGVDPDFNGELNIPTYTSIGGEIYRVTEICDNAFHGNKSISGVRINNGVLRIGRHAFSDTGVTVAITGKETEIIDDSAFAGCASLKRLYLGAKTVKFGTGAFGDCNITSVYYPLDLNSFEGITNYTEIDTQLLIPHTQIHSTTICIPVFSEAKSIDNVTLNGNELTYLGVYAGGSSIRSVLFSIEDAREISGGEIVIYGKRKETYFGKDGATPVDSESAISGCRVCECFDGRIFLSGNPLLPNTVFYTARDDPGATNPAYFGELNYFEDGIGDYPVSAMLSAGDSLAVFKSGDDGGGSIFYHVPSSTDSNILQKIYPVSYVHNGIACLGSAISFFDDPLFITKNGLYSLDKQTINLDRSVVCRSHNVNPLMLREDLTGASMAKWQGYLALLAGSSIYLADSRATFLHETGAVEYEWYYLSGIGCHADDKREYFYASVAPKGHLVHPDIDGKVTGVVRSEKDSNGVLNYFCYEGGKKYAVYASEEFDGGAFHKATTLCAAGDDLLFFGTSGGDLCVFNNDKRGVPPDRILSDPDFDPEEYATAYGRRIHPHFYDFAGHSVRYAIKTAKDDCSVPHLTKSTVKHSLAIKCRNLGHSVITCEVGTDKGGFSEVTSITGGETDFYDVNFSAMMLSADESITLPIDEKEKDWVEKQIVIYTDAFRAPFGIYSITYRYKIKGRIKKD